MKKIRHSKFKNTGFLFELLTKQITLEVLNGSEEKSKEIIKEFFAGKTELAKELRLFNLLINEKYNSETKAEKFIDAILEAHTRLDYSKLKREKYNLIKSIKETLDIDNLMSSPVTNYKVLASVHKLFESKIINVTDVKDVFDSKLTLVEHISTKNTTLKVKEDKLVEDYKKQEKELHSMYKGMKDKITKIKLRETINVLKKQKIGKKITDEQVSSLMLSFELIKEIKNVNGKES